MSPAKVCKCGQLLFVCSVVLFITCVAGYVMFRPLEGASVAEGARQGEASRSRFSLLLSNLVSSAVDCDETFLWRGRGHFDCSHGHAHQPDC